MYIVIFDYGGSIIFPKLSEIITFITFTSLKKTQKIPPTVKKCCFIISSF